MPLCSSPTAADAATERPTQGPLALCIIGGAGLLLIWCSFIFDEHAVRVLLRDFGETRLLPRHDIILAQVLAAGLNAAKVALSMIIAHRLVAGLGTFRPKLARLLVLALSLALALVVFGSETISPEARAEYEARLAEATTARDAARPNAGLRLVGAAEADSTGSLQPAAA